MSLVADFTVDLQDFRLEIGLEVGGNEVVGVLGPNGSGKTTLLRAIAGLVPLASGRIELNGEVLEDVAAHRSVHPEERSLGFVFQDYLLFPHLSVLDNVAFALRARGLTRPDAEARALDALRNFGIESLVGSRPNRLSAGQAQRVALARALVAKPSALLLDEPLAAFDFSARAAARRELPRWLETFPGIRLLVTHDPVDAVTLCNKIVVLEQGRIVHEGRVGVS
ncbi:MAG: ATP-binding cassette domain-containing protein [Actinomycetota bacterium]|nr:ATP-binding cassette domain-containing protein [Actinomycetota bacterium]